MELSSTNGGRAWPRRHHVLERHYSSRRIEQRLEQRVASVGNRPHWLALALQSSIHLPLKVIRETTDAQALVGIPPLLRLAHLRLPDATANGEDVPVRVALFDTRM